MGSTSPSVLFCYRNFGSYAGDTGYGNWSHGGLCNNARWSVKVLRGAGVPADAAAVWVAADVLKVLRARPGTTHVILEALFISAADLAKLAGAFPNVTWVCRCHSQVAFLAVAPPDVALLRDYLLLQDTQQNFFLSGNSQRLCRFAEETYAGGCLYLPNLYAPARAGARLRSPRQFADTLRIGSFGAIRLLKFHLVAAAAALMLARRLGKQLEFHINVGRLEHQGGTLAGIEALFAHLPWATLAKDPWTSWAQFRQTAANMDLCYQLSATETFNLVTADATSEGVASVVGDAIEWAPDAWRAPIDDPEAAARVGIGLLYDPFAVQYGQAALAEYCAAAEVAWLAWLAP